MGLMSEGSSVLMEAFRRPILETPRISRQKFLPYTVLMIHTCPRPRLPHSKKKCEKLALTGKWSFMLTQCIHLRNQQPEMTNQRVRHTMRKPTSDHGKP